MPSFAVRVAESNEVVGIFSASTVAGLRRVVDECTNTWLCEYVRLSTEGGVYVFHSTPAQWPVRFFEERQAVHKDDENAFNGASTTERWFGDISDGDWKPLGYK